MGGCAKKTYSTQPTQRIVEIICTGQIHFDKMDRKGPIPSRVAAEGIVEGDKKFAALLKYLKEKALPKIFDTWDELV